VEVRPSKQLHRHVLPIIIPAAGLLILSLATFSSYTFPVASRSSGQAFVTNLISVKAYSNGLAHISLNRQAPPAIHTQSSPRSSNDSVGTVTQLTVNLAQQAAD
jgi:hypothetical protein